MELRSLFHHIRIRGGLMIGFKGGLDEQEFACRRNAKIDVLAKAVAAGLREPRSLDLVRMGKVFSARQLQNQPGQKPSSRFRSKAL
jgi:hypothetical protein